MQLMHEMARHFREAFFGENWTEVDLKTALEGLTWQEAVTRVENLNTISALVFHIGYFTERALNVFRNEKLTGDANLSFQHPPIHSKEDWEQLVDNVFANASLAAESIAQLDPEKLFEVFGDPKYGSYYRNINGIIEHTYYHTGQIVLIKKLLRKRQ